MLSKKQFNESCTNINCTLSQKIKPPLLDKYFWNEVTLNGNTLVKTAARLLDGNWVNNGGLDLLKEVLWVSVGQRSAELQAVKVRDKKNLPLHPAQAKQVWTGQSGRIYFWSPTWTARSSAALWPKQTHIASLERSKPLLLTQFLFNSLAALLKYFISIQNDLISIVFI